MIPVYYAACACTVWPLVPGNRVGRCGRCDTRPETPATEQDRERYLATGELP